MSNKSTKNKRLVEPIKVYGHKRTIQNGNEQTNWKKPKTDESEMPDLTNMNPDEFMAYVESQLGKDWESEMKFKPGYIRQMLSGEGGTGFKSLLLSNLLPRIKEKQQQQQKTEEKVQIEKQPPIASSTSTNNNSHVNLPKKPVQTPAQTKGSKREFFCTIAGCSSSFPSLQLLQLHWQTFNHEIYRSPDGWFSCPKPNCLRKCNSIGALKSHLSAFHKEPSSIANVSFQKSTNPTVHHSTIHHFTAPSFRYPSANTSTYPSSNPSTYPSSNPSTYPSSNPSTYQSANPSTYQLNPEVLLQQATGIHPEQWRKLELERQQLKKLVAAKKSNDGQNLNQDNNDLLNQKELDKIAFKLLTGNMD